MTPRAWTHRRLGIGAGRLTDRALAETDAMLSRVGGRSTGAAAPSLDGDSFESALLDFTCEVDVLAGVPALDATPVATDLLRLAPASRRKRRQLSWRMGVPAMGAGLVALAVAVTLLVTGTPPSTTTPSLSAAAESTQLLRHADTLITAATGAVPAKRAVLVREAKADLRHVGRLLPLTPPQTRSSLRAQLHVLRHRMPTATPSSGENEQPTSSNATTSSTQPPPRHRRPPTQSGSDQGTGTSTTTTSGGSGGSNGRPLERRPGSGGSPAPDRMGVSDREPAPPAAGASPPPRDRPDGTQRAMPTRPGTGQCLPGAARQGC
jgi:hypothetical protein